MNKELIEELKAQDFNVVAVSKTRKIGRAHV